MDEPVLLIETSGRGGRVGLVAGGVLRERSLDPTRRHARDLAPAVGDLLTEAGLTPHDVRRIGVSIGPGSFTGLRVGIMSAKSFAYATGCELVAVPTFTALAESWSNPETTHLHVIADGLQGLIYHEGFERALAGWQSNHPLSLVSIADWRDKHGPQHTSTTGVTGPGSALVSDSVSPEMTKSTLASPTLTALLTVTHRLTPLSREDLLTLEPLYLRGSSAEEKAARDRRQKG